MIDNELREAFEHLEKTALSVKVVICTVPGCDCVFIYGETKRSELCEHFLELANSFKDEK